MSSISTYKLTDFNNTPSYDITDLTLEEIKIIFTALGMIRLEQDPNNIAHDLRDKMMTEVL